jgi:5-formyltetrahydrofolate cyclo-ligase
MKTKNEIRHAVRVQRAHLTLEQIDTQSKAAIERLRELPVIQQARTLACYLAKPFEVQTQRFIESCLTGGKRVCVPRHLDEPSGYAWNWVQPGGAWRDGPWRIPEPAQSDLAKGATIEAVIVPAVALDSQGHRVGHGGGNFDRLLTGVECPRVGLVFDFQILDEVPVEAHDAPVHFVVSEARTIQA